MRYIGCKTLMLDKIQAVIHERTENVQTITDIFSGTGVVAKMLKGKGFNVFSNDILYFSFAINKGTLEMNNPITQQLREIIGHLNQLTLENSPWFDLESAFIYQNYSPHENCNRMYFQNDNAIKIDLIRQEIERLKNQVEKTEYYYLLALLINAVPYVSNITGTYGAYLKYWDKRTFNKLQLEEINIEPSEAQCTCFNMDSLALARQITSDLTYLDPPYNGRQYMPNYHILETIAKYDYPKIKGITGMREDPDKLSDYCKKGRAKQAFRELLSSLNSKYVLLSYNNEGLLSTDEMSQIVRESGVAKSFKIYEFNYRRYKNKIPNNTGGLKEQLYFVQKNI